MAYLSNEFVLFEKGPAVPPPCPKSHFFPSCELLSLISHVAAEAEKWEVSAELNIRPEAG